MIRVIIKIGIDQIAEAEGHHSVVEVSMDRIIGEDHAMSIIIEMILGETILEKCKITEVKILAMDIEGIIEMTTLEEVEVGPGKEKFSRNEVVEVEVGHDQVQEPVLIETELHALSVGNMIISLKTVQIHKQKEPEQIQQMYNFNEDQTAFKVLATDTYDNLIRIIQ